MIEMLVCALLCDVPYCNEPNSSSNKFILPRSLVGKIGLKKAGNNGVTMFEGTLSSVAPEMPVSVYVVTM